MQWYQKHIQWDHESNCVHRRRISILFIDPWLMKKNLPKKWWLTGNSISTGSDTALTRGVIWRDSITYGSRFPSLQLTRERENVLTWGIILRDSTSYGKKHEYLRLLPQSSRISYYIYSANKLCPVRKCKRVGLTTYPLGKYSNFILLASRSLHLDQCCQECQFRTEFRKAYTRSMFIFKYLL